MTSFDPARARSIERGWWSRSMGYAKLKAGRLRAVARYNVRRWHLSLGVDAIGSGELTVELGPLSLQVWIEPRMQPGWTVAGGAATAEGRR